MSFLNLALLGGAAAFLVPLVIHLLNRSRHQSIDWGAMHLLEAAMQVNSKRFQWESVLLLMLRCLIPILFAIGLARPVLTSLRSANAQGEASVLVVVDNSLSMLVKDKQQPEQNRFDRAVNEVRKILGSQTRADLSVMSSGGGAPRNEIDGSTFDAGLALRSIAKIQAGAGPSDPVATIEAAVAQLSKMSHPNKQLVVASDFQASQWGSLSITQKERVKELLQSASQPVQLTLLPVGAASAADSIENLSVELSAESSKEQLEPTFAGEPVLIEASVRNWGSKPVSNITVSFLVDEQAVASELVSLQPNSQQQVHFACSFKTVGRHLFSVKLERSEGVADQLPSDDTTSGVINVHTPIRILVIDSTSANRDDSVGRFLQLALSPMSSDTSFKVQLSQRMPPDEELKQCNVLVLVGSPFDDNQAKKIAAYVEQGGGLLLFAADGMDSARIHRVWLDQAKLLPGKFLDRKSASADQAMRIKKQNYQDSVLSIFNSSDQGDLLSVQFQQWQPLQVQVAPSRTNSAETTAGNETGSEAASVLDSTSLLLEDDTLVLAKKSFGQGWVIQCGVNPDPKWSNLATRSVFVPLMQRLTLALLGEGLQPPQQFITGQMPSFNPNLLRIESVSNVTSHPDTDNSWEWIEPTGSASKLTLSETPSNTADNNEVQKSVNLPMIRWPGVYRVKSSDASSAVNGQVFLAAGVPNSESDTKLMTPEQIQQLATSFGATTVDSANSFQVKQQVLRDGKEIWRPLVMVLVVFLFGEIFLARRVTRGG